MPDLLHSIVPPGTVIKKVKQLEETKSDFIQTNVPPSTPLDELNPGSSERIEKEVW